MSDSQHDIRRENGDGAPSGGGRPLASGLARLSYAKVVATLALFVALGGTATAVVTLPRDSVGAVQIRQDGVRSPEIREDAVRSPEIRADAVRSSEIRNESILLADIAPGARTALDAPRVLDAQDDADVVPACGEGGDLAACSNRLSVLLPSGSWLVQGKLVIAKSAGFASGGSLCGLVRGDGTTLDQAPIVRATADGEVIALTGVLSGVPDDTRVGLRCREGVTEELELANLTLTALEVRPVTGA